MNDDWVQALLETSDGTLWIGTVTGPRPIQKRASSCRRGGASRAPIVTALLESATASSGSPRASASRGSWTERDHDVFLGRRPYRRPRVRADAEDARGDLWVGGRSGARPPRKRRRFQLMDPQRRISRRVLRCSPTPEGASGRARDAGSPRLDGRTVPGCTSAPRDSRIRWSGRSTRDRDANLWLGTEGGLFRFRDGRFLRHGADEGLSTTVSSRSTRIAKAASGSAPRTAA